MDTDKNHKTQGTIVILTDEYIAYPKLVIDNLAAVLNESGYGLLCITGRELSQTPNDKSARSACNTIYSLAHSNSIKGLISISGSIGHSIDIKTLDNFLAQFNIPKISLNATTTDVPSVVQDDFSGMRQLMQHLLNDDSRQHIAFVRGYLNDPYSHQREQVFREMMIEYNRNIDESLFIRGNYNKFETFSAVTDLLDQAKKIDAIVAANDLMALSAARAISTKGLRIPDDIALTGYDDTSEATQNSPALTTVRQPIELIATSCVKLLLTTIEKFSYKQDGNTIQSPDVITVHNELIPRGSTVSTTYSDAEEIISTKKNICSGLQTALSGLVQPEGVTITSITDAYWDSWTTGSNQLSTYIYQHLESFVNYEHIHWWSNLCHQLQRYTQLTQDQLSSNKNDSSVIASLAEIQERTWSARLEHEFEVHRLEIVHKQMQLQMSSCTTSDEILLVLTNWLDTLGATRCFLVQFESPAEKPTEWSTLVHSYRNGQVDTCSDEQFRTEDLLPTTLQYELGYGFLIVCPIHAGNLLFGYLLIDPSGLEHLELESTSNCIGNAMRNHYLIQTLEKQANSLQTVNKELYTLAQYDALTDLPNRLNFQQRLADQCEASINNNKWFALLFIDLDGFKHINDTLGHDAGDRLLQAVAQRLKNLMCTLSLEHVFIARLGGDEFTVIIDQIENREAINHLNNKILEVLRSSFQLGRHSLTVSGSIGCAFFPDNGTDAETLVKHADTAMYQAKDQGKNCIAFYNPEMGDADKNFLRLDQDMRTGIHNNEFHLFFQPKISLLTNQICGVEALMRWQVDSPEGMKFHSTPDEFIPIAESTGFIIQLDLFALEQACLIARRWELKGRKLPVAVNLSVVLLQKENFIELVSSILNKSHLSPSLLEFEITESAVMMEVESNVEKLSELRNRGIKISIDDFGTGYSSLSYLKKLPISSLKIDRSFISDLGTHNSGEAVDKTIVQSVVAIGKNMDLTVVAEGVETKEQMELLRQIGCEQAQGYLLSKPLPLIELEMLLMQEQSFDDAA